MNSLDFFDKIPDKQYKWKGTTSLKWKKDIYEYFVDLKLENSLEIGTNQGWTSFLLSYLSSNVFTIEYLENNIVEAKKHCEGRSNITFIHGDAYKDSTYNTIPTVLDIVVVDCIHTYPAVLQDISRALHYKGVGKPLYLVFDDYSHPTSTGVRHAVDEFITKNNIVVEKYVGHTQGHTIHRNDGTSFILNGPEGLILKIE